MRLQLCIAKEEVDSNVSNTQLHCNHCMGKVKSHRHTIEVNTFSYGEWNRHTDHIWVFSYSVKLKKRKVTNQPNIVSLQSQSLTVVFVTSNNFYSKQCLTPYPCKLNKGKHAYISVQPVKSSVTSGAVSSMCYWMLPHPSLVPWPWLPTQWERIWTHCPTFVVHWHNCNLFAQSKVALFLIDSSFLLTV